MEVEFKTLRELKQRLPEVLRDIKRLRLLADAERVIMKSQIRGACEVLVGEQEPSWWYTSRGIEESYRNLMYYEMRAKWLQAQVDKLKNTRSAC